MKETRNYFTTPSNYADHSTFGGVIYTFDFCTDYEGTKNIASRIASDLKFDERCRKNAINRYKNNKMQKGNN